MMPGNHRGSLQFPGTVPIPEVSITYLQMRAVVSDKKYASFKLERGFLFCSR